MISGSVAETNGIKRNELAATASSHEKDLPAKTREGERPRGSSASHKSSHRRKSPKIKHSYRFAHQRRRPQLISAAAPKLT
jgi:hypothetical protein